MVPFAFWVNAYFIALRLFSVNSVSSVVPIARFRLNYQHRLKPTLRRSARRLPETKNPNPQTTLLTILFILFILFIHVPFFH